MARLSNEVRHSLIGAAAIAVLAALFVLGYSGDPKKFDGDGYRVYAIYETATGLGPGSQVLMAGIPVGAVRMMLLDKDTNDVRVELTIEEGVDIPIDSEAAIVSDGFAGGKYIRIIPGGDYEMLQQDDVFDYARGSIDFLELFERIVVMAETRRENAADAADSQ